MSLMLEEKVKAPWKWVSKFKGESVAKVAVEEPVCENPPVIEGLSAGVLYVPDTMKPIDWTPVEKETIDVSEVVGKWVDTAPKPTTLTPLVVQFCRALREVIEEAGSTYICPARWNDLNTAQGMRYVFEGSGDCIIGRTLVKMGKSVSDIYPYEGTGAPMVIQGLFASQPGVEDVMRLASQAQTVNDSRQPWGLALPLTSGSPF